MKERQWKRRLKPNTAKPATGHGVLNETVKLIRKLRWVGLEERAERLEKQLEEHAASETVIATQSDTD